MERWNTTRKMMKSRRLLRLLFVWKVFYCWSENECGRFPSRKRKRGGEPAKTFSRPRAPNLNFRDCERLYDVRLRIENEAKSVEPMRDVLTFVDGDVIVVVVEEILFEWYHTGRIDMVLETHDNVVHLERSIRE